MSRNTQHNQVKQIDVAKLQDIIDASRQFDEQIESMPPEKVTLFMGNTKAGKSTIVNYMIGNRLVSKMHDREYKNYLAQADSNSQGPRIGSSALSETTHPTMYRSPYNGVIFDLPGFEDNRGPTQDISNSFFLRSIINKSESCKLVLVSDFNDIDASNVGRFGNLLKNVHDLFPNISANLRGVSIIFTHYENPNLTPPPSYTDVITGKLTSKFITTPFFAEEPELSRFVEHFIENPECISIFEQPSLTEHTYQIMESDLISRNIANTSYIPKESLRGGLPISSDSKMSLHDNKQYLLQIPEFDSLLNKILKAYKRTLNNLEDYIVNANQETTKLDSSEKAMQTITTIMNIHDNPISIYDCLEQLSRINPKVAEKISNSSIKIREKFIGFIDSILGIQYERAYIQTIYATKIKFSTDSITMSLMNTKISLDLARKSLTVEEAQAKFQEIKDTLEVQETGYQQIIQNLEEANRTNVTILDTVGASLKTSAYEGVKNVCISLPAILAVGALGAPLLPMFVAGAAARAAYKKYEGGTATEAAINAAGADFAAVRGLFEGIRNSKQNHEKIKLAQQTLGEEKIKKESEWAETKKQFDHTKSELDSQQADLNGLRNTSSIIKNISSVQAELNDSDTEFDYNVEELLGLTTPSFTEVG